jgi:hypothetical protein
MVLDIILIFRLVLVEWVQELFNLARHCPLMSYQIVVWERNGNYETYLVEHVKATGLHIRAVPVRMVTHCRIPFPEERIDTRHDFSDYTRLESDA